MHHLILANIIHYTVYAQFDICQHNICMSLFGTCQQNICPPLILEERCAMTLEQFPDLPGSWVIRVISSQGGRGGKGEEKGGRGKKGIPSILCTFPWQIVNSCCSIKKCTSKYKQITTF